MRILTAGVLAAILGFGADPALAADRKPNVVFILADDLGYSDVACYGGKFYRTPNIDRMATEGIRLTDGYSCGPNCQPTRAALISGQYGPRTGVYTVGSIDRFAWRTRPLRPVDNVAKLPLETFTLAQAIQEAGYATALFGKWHLGQDADHHPSKRGFDEAIVSMGRHFDFKTIPPVDYPAGTYLADFLTDKAVDFITRHKDEPFFLALHHFGVHSPYQAKPEIVARFVGTRPEGGHDDPTYAAMIASVDESVGRVLKTIDDLGLGDDTLVIFTSDNGGVGGYSREGIRVGHEATDNAPLRGGKGMLYEGGVRVPYIFRWPGRIPAGATSDRPVNSVDLYPTLMEVTGGRAKSTLDGTGYLRLLTTGGADRPGRDALYWHFPGYLGAARGDWRTTPAGAIRDGDWKLLEFFETGKVELYNLRDDPGETRDLAAADPDRAGAMHARLVDWRKHVKAPMPTPHTPEPEAARTKKQRKQADEDE
ncbi:sulfatase [Planctomyces sp. SH-PL62]|uniref:sulfatase n=1 Tax=Planctomyces sp. SH-PL62 TaxID=1636152 RepID=UPI00078CE7B3|nr:sulfatase [Planctomyces sp. SH-PL62]AMV35907.1 Arylsulfatase [Planctomyces sp. SH-PL62]